MYCLGKGSPRVETADSRLPNAMSALASRLLRSLVVSSSCSTLRWSWLLTVFSSSLSDCSSCERPATKVEQTAGEAPNR